MPTITSSPKLQNSLGEVANGIIVFKASSSFESGGNVITTAAGKGVVRDGVLLTSQQGGALFVPTTPFNVVMEIVLILDEFRDGQVREVESLRTVTVPNVATVSWSALVDVVPVASAGEFVVPQWATDVLVARDTTVTKAAEAAASAASALASKNAAQAVGNTNDTIMQGVDGNAASAFRVQADARQSAATASAIAAKISTPAAFTPVWSAGTQVALAEATGRWTRVGKQVTYQFYVRCSVANTAGTWLLDLPVSGVTIGGIPALGTVGVGTAGVYNSAQAVLDSSTRMKFLMPGSTGYLATAPAVNNEIFGSITYEAV